MNRLIQLKATSAVLIALTLLGFAPLPGAQAVVPTPDGGYPGFNTAEGQNALFSLTTGSANTAVGWFSLFTNAGGSFNTATGAGTLLFNTADQNTAFGAAALLFNTAGASNTAVGAAALLNNTGDGQGRGNSNTAVGNSALSSNTTGSDNTAVGESALANNNTSDANTAVGFNALLNSTGSFEAAFGDNALPSLTSGDGNCAIGESAARDLTMGTSNAAIGNSALRNTTTGDHNTAIGVNALFRGSPTTGSDNIALGYFAGQNIDGNNNIDIGNAGVAGESDTTRIGGTQTRTFIAGINNATVTGVPVLVDANGQLGVAASSGRFKKEIKPMDKASEAILALKPVTFHYKTDGTNTPQFGLIAEDVAAVNPDLIVRDKDGEIYTVRYDAVNAMLLNEFLKEHRKNEEQELTITRLQKQIEALTAGLQQVSARLDASDDAPQVVNNTRKR